MFLYIIDKPGEARIGNPKVINEVNVDILEEWGRKPGHEIVQVHALASEAETCQL